MIIFPQHSHTVILFLSDASEEVEGELDEVEPEIAGQLIVFDLDEDPPSYMQTSRLQEEQGTVDYRNRNASEKGLFGTKVQIVIFKRVGWNF